MTHTTTITMPQGTYRHAVWGDSIGPGVTIESSQSDWWVPADPPMFRISELKVYPTRRLESRKMVWTSNADVTEGSWTTVSICLPMEEGDIWFDRRK